METTGEMGVKDGVGGWKSHTNSKTDGVEGGGKNGVFIKKSLIAGAVCRHKRETHTHTQLIILTRYVGSRIPSVATGVVGAAGIGGGQMMAVI